MSPRPAGSAIYGLGGTQKDQGPNLEPPAETIFTLITALHIKDIVNSFY